MPVKILHTADWHIGKQLHGCSLEEDHTLFLKWLTELILRENVDLLLVSGDIFDTAFPSNLAQKQYYQFLKSLVNSSCRVVITGGNHDSPGVLNAPRELLNVLNIHVVGQATENPSDSLLVFEDLGIAVAAVPFLRESDLRKSASGQSYEDRISLIREGIIKQYASLISLHRSDYKQLMLIGMGHLHVNGVTDTSESEREIHVVGGLAAFDKSDFPAGYEYMALGHIHKPQRLGDRIRYSGSPIPLSFSEREQQKHVLLLEKNGNEISSITEVPVPAYRSLKTFAGTLAEVKESLGNFSSENNLPTLAEVIVTEENYSPEKVVQFDALKREWEKAINVRVVKPRIFFLNQLKDTAELFRSGAEIEDMTPKQVFEERLTAEKLDEPTAQLLREAFDELLREMDEKVD